MERLGLGQVRGSNRVETFGGKGLSIGTLGILDIEYIGLSSVERWIPSVGVSRRTSDLSTSVISLSD